MMALQAYNSLAVESQAALPLWVLRERAQELRNGQRAAQRTWWLALNAAIECGVSMASARWMARALYQYCRSAA